MDNENIQPFLGSCPCINIASSIFERNIPSRLQNIAKIASTKCRKIGGLRNYQRGGNLQKGEVNFERGVPNP